MQIWPAIDLRGGKCVRLEQGDYGRETVFGDDPVEMALSWVRQGAQCLHLVDLDGARSGQPENLDAVARILAAVDVPCELGGGIRDAPSIDSLLKQGLSRLVVGTRALDEPDWFRSVCRQYPGRLALGLDARDGLVATHGWLRTSNVPAAELARCLESEPVAAIIYTDIARDGMLRGPNLQAVRDLCSAVRLPVIASGGVGRIDDIAELAQAGAAGCIIGRALYDGTLDLAEALAAALGVRPC